MLILSFELLLSNKAIQITAKRIAPTIYKYELTKSNKILSLPLIKYHNSIGKTIKTTNNKP